MYDATYDSLARRIRQASPAAFLRAFGSKGTPIASLTDPTAVGVMYPDLRAAWRFGLRGAAYNARRYGSTVRVFDGEHNHKVWTDRQNFLFRCHHDAIHVLEDADFSLEGEIRTWAATCVDLGIHDIDSEAARVLYGEIVMQRPYFEEHGSFPVDPDGTQPIFEHTPAMIRALHVDCFSAAVDPIRHMLHVGGV